MSMFGDDAYKNDTAVVLSSGGQDSTTCLYWAKEKFRKVIALGFDYGQKHALEIKAQLAIALCANVPYQRLPIKALEYIGNSVLTGEEKASCRTHPMNSMLPDTFVPFRNMIFLTIAAAYALSKESRHLVTGVCETDYSGYPDCRQEFIYSLETTLHTALGGGMNPFVTIHTPLMHMTKADTVRLAASLPGCMKALKYSHTCYNNKSLPCRECDACKLRQKGFEEAGITDPLYWRE